MAAGDPINGDALRIEVSATAIGTKTPVNGMDRYGSRKSRPINRRAVFMRAAPYMSRGTKDYGFTISGALIPDDPGQQMLRDAEANGTSVFLSIMPDGVNGFMQEVICGNLSHDANPDAFQDYGFECSGVAEPTLVGTPGVIV